MMFRDFFESLKFFVQKITSSKFVVTGKCRRCGTCCRNITFFVGNRIVTSEAEFQKMQEFDKKYRNFEISGKGENGELLFRCKALKENGSCGVYRFRSVNCRLYPRVNQKFVYDGGVPLDGCGYSFSVNKKFKDYLD